MFRVNNKVALVTGGGDGIGQACCELLAQAGAKVVVTGRTLASVESTAAAINAMDGEAIAIQQDVADEAGWDRVVNRTVEQFGTLDILVNNAGIVSFAECKDVTVEDWNQVLDINLKGSFLGCRAAIKQMVKHKTAGSIINMSSGFGLFGGGPIPYSASKGGVNMLTKSLAVDCARYGCGIRVNTVYPGSVITKMNPADQHSESADFLNKIPSGRFGLPVDIANGVLFLASDAASFITGTDLIIDGGFSATC